MPPRERGSNPRSLAGKPLAGFRATPSRRITVLYGMVVYILRFTTPLLTSPIDVKKTTAWGESGFPARLLEALKLFFNDVKRCIFVLGDDRAVVEAAIAKHYDGAELVGKQYLDKIVQIGLTVPPATIEGIKAHFSPTLTDIGIPQEDEPIIGLAAQGNPRIYHRILNNWKLIRLLRGTHPAASLDRSTEPDCCWRQPFMYVSPVCTYVSMATLKALSDYGTTSDQART